MRRLTPEIVLLLLGGLAFLPCAAQPEESRGADGPRLILTPELRDRVRAAIARGGTHRAIFELLKAQTDRGEGWFDRNSGNWNYGRSYRAVSAAAMYQFTGQRRYCDLAYTQLQDIYGDPDPDRRLPTEGYGLGRATVGLGLAFGYDWCRTAWNLKERAWAEERMTEALDAWPLYRHANLEAEHRGSNWVSVCRGGELLLMLGARQELRRAARFTELKEDLRRHMANFDELGVSQEGIGYTAYGGIFLMRALWALRAVGDQTLEQEAARHAWWKQAMYSGALGAIQGKRSFLMSGVGGPGIGDEGWTSLLIPFVPPQHLPHYLFWYDRHMGLLSPEPQFEAQRDGRVWALLAYPVDVQPADPTDVLPKAVSGAQGLTLFRNHWRDEGDILVSVHADTQWHSHAWDQPEALQIGLLTQGTLFIAGPNKDREREKFSKPLIGGRVTTAAQGPQGTGALREFTAAPGGGSVTVEGGTQYAALGVRIVRNVQVGFFSDRSAVLLVTDDLALAGGAELRNGVRVRWQIRSLAEGAGGDLRSVRQPKARAAVVPLLPEGAVIRGRAPGALGFDVSEGVRRIAVAILVGSSLPAPKASRSANAVRWKAGDWEVMVPLEGKPVLRLVGAGGKRR